MELLSLYDYLGKPAGSELGIKVNEAAKKQGVRYNFKEIDNPKYKGKIMTYPKSFLDDYFGYADDARNDDISIDDDQSFNGWEPGEDDLPF